MCFAAILKYLIAACQILSHVNYFWFPQYPGIFKKESTQYFLNISSISKKESTYI